MTPFQNIKKTDAINITQTQIRQVLIFHQLLIFFTKEMGMENLFIIASHRKIIILLCRIVHGKKAIISVSMFLLLLQMEKRMSLLQV